MHNVCCLTAQPPSSFLLKKSALGLGQTQEESPWLPSEAGSSTGKQFLLCRFCRCQPRSRVYLVSSLSAPHSLVQQSAARQSSCSGLMNFPGKVRVLPSDRQGSEPFFPGGFPRNHLLLPWSLSICDSGFQRTLGSLLLRSHDPHLTF